MRIFIIDDEAHSLADAERAVRAAAPGAEVVTFSCAESALKRVAEGCRPDVVFSDICMPGLDGLELAVRLRDVCPTVKTVFVTAHAGYAVEAFAIHAQGYVLSL